MTTKKNGIQPADVKRVCTSLILEFGGTDAIWRACYRASQYREEHNVRPAELWEQVEAMLREMVPADQHLENQYPGPTTYRISSISAGY